MELGNDQALRPVDDERAALGDQRQLPEIDFLLDPVLFALDASTSSRGRGAPRLSGAEELRSRSTHSSIEYLGSPISNATNSSENSSRGSLMGTHPWNTSCSPRSCGAGIDFHLEEIAEALELEPEKIRDWRFTRDRLVKLFRLCDVLSSRPSRLSGGEVGPAA